MSKFRKKPVVIEARQLTIHNIADIKYWCNGITWSDPPMRAVTGISIETLEGTMNAEFGDWRLCPFLILDTPKKGQTGE